jgi:redox-sensitive bicupin YhaK (pirin superfamily)
VVNTTGQQIGDGLLTAVGVVREAGTLTAEGAGARVRRSIGTAKLRNFSPFLMLDHFTIGKGTDMSVMGKTVGVGIFKLRWFV